MGTLDYTTVNLGLPALPEVTDPKLFYELTKIYNAIKILAQGVDTYTSDGTVPATLSDIANQLENIIDTAASHAELRKKYYGYTVPKFTVTGKFACNGKPLSAAVPIIHTAGTASGTGTTGTAAGGFADAATRDLAIAAINDNAFAVAEIQNILRQFGFGV